MPCRYDESPQEIAARKRVEIDVAVRPYKEKLDLVTRIACELTQMIAVEMAEGDDEPETPDQTMQRLRDCGLITLETYSWWLDHTEADRKREAESAAITAVRRDIRKLVDSLKQVLPPGTDIAALLKSAVQE